MLEKNYVIIVAKAVFKGTNVFKTVLFKRTTAKDFVENYIYFFRNWENSFVFENCFDRYVQNSRLFPNLMWTKSQH